MEFYLNKGIEWPESAEWWILLFFVRLPPLARQQQQRDLHFGQIFENICLKLCENIFISFR